MSGLHGLSFIRPVPANCFVHVRSEGVHATGDAMTVLVSAHAEDPMSGALAETVRAFMTYSPMDWATVRIPRFEQTNDEDRALHDEVGHRLSLQRVIGGEGAAA